MVLAVVVESTDLASVCAGSAGWWEEFNKETVASASTSIPRESCLDPCLSSLSLKLVNLVPPSVSQVLFELVPLCWSLELVNL